MPLNEERAFVTVDTILLATDFSPASVSAASYAKAFALRFGSVVDLANVFVREIATTYGEAWVPMPDQDSAERTMDVRMDQLHGEFSVAGINNRISLSEGSSVGDEILKIAKDQKIELIVVGTESKSGLDRLLLGSTAEELIRRAQCPVLTVGPHVKKVADAPLVFRNIVYATDLTPEAAKAAAFALSFAQDSGAHLYYCYVLDSPIPGFATRGIVEAAYQDTLRRLIPESAYDWCSPECVVEHGGVARAVLDLAQRVNADLIVLGARKTSFWLRHLERGLTPQLLAEASCPVLTVC